jgi:undecaprenyl-diphosphatase
VLNATPLTPIEAAVLGLVEGLTEFLPVSSTGHLILASELLGRTGDPHVNAFNIVVQGGAILAVIGLYRHRVVQMTRGLLGKDPAGLRMLSLLTVAFLPAALLGPLLDDRIEADLFFATAVAFALAIGGVLMIGFDLWRHRSAPGEGRTLESLTMRDALWIGLMQCMAMWPGTSRSLATIAGGLLIRLSPAAAAEFSFLLALPTLGAATAYKLMQHGGALVDGVGPSGLAIGMLVAFVSAIVAMNGLVRWLQRHGFWLLGVYRIGLAVAVWFLWPDANP